MQRDLERRLLALETSWFGSPKIAAFHLAVSAMSDEELIDAIVKADSGADCNDPHLRHFSAAELDRVIKDNDRAIRADQLLDGTE
jgi:hypothetical protein